MFFQNKLQILVMIFLEMKLSVIEGANLTCLKNRRFEGLSKEGVNLSPPKNLIRKLMRDGARINRIKMFGLPYGFEPPYGILPRLGRREREGRR